MPQVHSIEKVSDQPGTVFVMLKVRPLHLKHHCVAGYRNRTFEIGFCVIEINTPADE